MRESTIRVSRREEPCATPLAMVELDRRVGVTQHAELGAVELVEHLVVWVLDGGVVLAAVVKRSAHVAGQCVDSRRVSPRVQAGLSASERLDVLHAAGLREDAARAPKPVRWEVA